MLREPFKKLAFLYSKQGKSIRILSKTEISEILSHPLPAYRSLTALLAISALFFENPYLGIKSDAVHYALVSLYNLDPGGWQNEMLFAKGRSNYTVFPILFGYLIDLIGVGPAHLTTVITSQLVFLTALISLSATLFGATRLAAISVICTLVFQSRYGCAHCSSYIEMIATPRTLAMGLSLYALSFALQNRRPPSVLFVSLAFMLHPLMALPVFLVIMVIILGISAKLAWVAAALTSTCLAVAFAGVMPFALIWQTYDPQWFQILSDTFPKNYFTIWELQSVILALFQICIIIIVAIFAPPQHQRLARALLLVGMSLLLLSILGHTFGANVLMTNLHLWRVTWLLALIGNLLAISAILQLPSRSKALGWLLLSICLYMLFQAQSFSSLAALAALSLLAVEYCSRSLKTNTAPSMVNVVFLGFALVIGMLAGWASILDGSLLINLTGRLPINLFLFGILALLLLETRLLLREYIWIPISMSFLLAMVAFSNWDQRSPWRSMYLEGNFPIDQSMIEFIGDANIYWENGAEILWLKLNRPSYFSCYQAASNILQRENAVEFTRRGEALRHLNTSDMRPHKHDWCPAKQDPNAFGPNSPMQLKDACNKLPELDILALQVRLENTPTHIFRMPYPEYYSPSVRIVSNVEDTQSASQTSVMKFGDVYFYLCKDFRNS